MCESPTDETPSIRSSPEVTELPTGTAEGSVLEPSSPTAAGLSGCSCEQQEFAASTVSSDGSTVDVSDGHYYDEVRVLTDALVALFTWPITFTCVFLPSPISRVVRGSTRPLVYRTTAVAKASARVLARTLRTVSTKESRVVVILFAEVWLRICALMTTKEMHELGDTFYRLSLAILQVLRTRNVEDLLESVKDLTGSTVQLIGQTSKDVQKIIDDQKREKALPAEPANTVALPCEQSKATHLTNAKSGDEKYNWDLTIHIDLKSPATVLLIVLFSSVWLCGILKVLEVL